jgi:hypothetical protein
MMEKPGGPIEHAAAIENPKAWSKLKLLRTPGGPQGGADEG